MIGHFIIHKLLNHRRGPRGLSVIGLSFTFNPNLIRSHIGLRIPVYRKGLVSRFSCNICRYIHLRLRNPALHIVDKLHAGYLCQIISPGCFCNTESHSFYGNLSSQKDAQGAVFLPFNLKFLLLHCCRFGHSRP